MPVPRAVRIALLPTLVACFVAFGAAAALGDDAVTASPPDSTVSATPTDATTTTSATSTQQDLTPDPSPPAGADYGASTAISGDTVLVGAPNDQGSGTVTIYTIGDDGTASPTGSLTPPDGGQFDFGTALGTDGSTIAVGTSGNVNTAQVDLYDAATYALLTQLLGADAGAGAQADFGSAVAISGDWLVVGAPGQGGGGTVYIYSRQDGVWVGIPYQSLTGADGSSFGQSVAIDGGTIVVGAPGETVDDVAAGAAHVYTLVQGEGGLVWAETGSPLYDPAAVDGGAFGSAVAINGTTIAVGAPAPGTEDPGHVAVFSDPFGAEPLASQTISGAAGDSMFGQSLALSDSYLAIGYVQPDSSGAVALYGHPTTTTSAGESPHSGAGGFSFIGNQTGTGPGDGFGKNLSGSGQYFVTGADGHSYLIGLGGGTSPPDPNPGPGPGPGPGTGGTTTGGATPGGAGPARPTGNTGSGSVNGASAHGSSSSSSPRQVVVQPKAVTPHPPGHHAAPRHLATPRAGAAGEQPAAGRSLFAGRVLTPGQVDLSAKNLAQGGFLAFILAALLYLPVTIFNKTTERNHETISGWFAGPRERLAALTAALPLSQHPFVLLLASGLIGGCLFSFIEPGFPTEAGSLQYLIGMIIGFLLVGVVFFGTWREVVHRLEPESQGRWRLYPPYILLAAVFVLVARLAHFLPGVVLGTLAEYEPGKQLSRRTAGLRVVVTYAALLVLGGAAWFAWIPVEHAAAKEGASSLTLILDATLTVTFVTGLESVVFGLIPLKFLDGNDLFVWHKGLWLALWGVGLYWFSVVILHPALSTYNEVSGAGAFWFGVLFSSLMIVAMSTWAYFRVRELREARVANDSQS